MLKNNNQEAVKRLGRRILKHNRTRNIFTILAIVLISFMFTTVFSIGFSLAKNMNVMKIRGRGTRAQLFLRFPTEEQIKAVKQCPALAHAGIMMMSGNAKAPGKEDFQIQLWYHDKENFNYHIMPAITAVKGNYPTEENEIMLSLDALKALHIDKPEIDMAVPLMVNGRQTDFLLSGFFEDYSFQSNSYMAYISKSFAENRGCSMEKSGILSMSAKPLSQKQLIEQLETDIIQSGDQNISISLTANELDDILVIVVLVAFISLLIVVSGYLLVYNIMYISVNQDIRFYGMLKTIGTTSRQIRKIVKMQAGRLSLSGISIGIGLGTLVSFAAVPFALNFVGGAYSYNGPMTTEISFHPLIYVGTILFAVATVSLSCRKPAKLAGRVSPVEALKYHGQISSKRKSRKSRTGGRIHKMAYRNVFREKKRAFLVFSSLLMGTLALLSTQAFIGSMKMENYANFYIPNDYAIYTDCYPDEDEYAGEVLAGESGSNESAEGEADAGESDSNESAEGEADTGASGSNESTAREILDPAKVKACEALAKDIKELDGIKDVMLNYTTDINLLFDKKLYMPFLKFDEQYSDMTVQEMIEKYEGDPAGSYYTEILGIDRKMMECHNRFTEQKIDIEAFEHGEICFMGFVDSEETAERIQGKTITLVHPDIGKKRNIKVGVCALRGDDAGICCGSYGHILGVPAYILVSQKVIQEFSDAPRIEGIFANCEKGAEADVTRQIKELTDHNICIPPYMPVQIKSEALEDFQTAMGSLNVLTAGISIVLLAIGVINFVNVMLTGLFTRKRELAVMESIGMTGKQLRKMLMLEGVYYSVIMAGLILTVGSGVVYMVAVLAEKMADYAVFCFPWQLMIAMLIVIAVVCISIPAIVYGYISKESVTERLRMGE